MAFDLQPHLRGELIELRPLAPNDWDELFAVASDSLIWEQHPERDRYKEDVFRVFFKEALESGGAFVVIDKKTQHIIGSTRFYGYDPKKSEIEIGWTFLARKYWGGRYNREMKELLLDHAFKFVENVVFLVGEAKLPFAKGHGKNWRNQSWNGDTGVRESSACDEPEVRDEQIPTMMNIHPSYCSVLVDRDPAEKSHFGWQPKPTGQRPDAPQKGLLALPGKKQKLAHFC